MRFLAIGFSALLLAASCAVSTSSAAAPSVAISSFDVVESNVSMIVTAAAGDDTVTISVDWGDGTSEGEVVGVGDFAYRHSYAADVTSAIISVAATSLDGTVASDVASFELVIDEVTTTSIPEPETTTTAAVSTTTSTSSTTTTEAPPPTTTTTKAPPPTTTSTTTTTLPEPVYVDFELDVETGTVVDRWGDGIEQSKWKDGVAEAHVVRHDDAWEVDGIQISFPIPRSEYESLFEDAASLTFEFVVYVDVDYTLDTDKTKGNEAKVSYGFTGNKFLGWAGESRFDSIGSDDNTHVVEADEFRGTWNLDIEHFTIAQDIDFTLECAAKGPGGFIIASDSKCDAEIRVVGISVHVAAD